MKNHLYFVNACFFKIRFYICINMNRKDQFSANLELGHKEIIKALNDD